MFKIGEFSKLSQVSIRMLRYYDETGLLRPARVDESTGYRLYSTEQIRTLHRIIFLRDTGFNVSEISDALRNWNDNFIVEKLRNKKEEIADVIRSEQEKINKINIAIADISEEKISVHCNFILKSIPSFKVLSLRKIISNYFKEGVLWEELYNFINEEHIQVAKNNEGFAIYHDVEYKESDVDVEVCVVVERMGEDKNGFTFRETEKVETMACAMVYGPYENIREGYENFAHWLTHHNQYKMVDQNRQTCHKGPWNEKNPNNYLTEIQIPIEKNEYLLQI